LGSKKKSRLKRIRSSSLLLAILGAIIVVWALTSFDYFGYNPPLIIGGSILCLGLVTLFRRKGDYDDFDDDVDNEADDGVQKETRGPE
jgi:hypothetical protein